jgi:hypothetical protein
MVKTCFVHAGLHLGSAKIRGDQIARELGCDTFLVKEFTPDQARGYDVVVYVKRLPAARVMEAIRRSGVKQVVDVLDNYSSWKLRLRLKHIDAFIAASLTQAVYLEWRYEKRAVELPHHHCNFEEQRIPAGRTPPTLGYVGDRHYWPASRWVEKRFREYPLVVDLLHHDLQDTFRAIDVGFAYRADARKRSFNSAIKLINYMSYGIASVMVPESAYTAVARHGVHCLFAHTQAEFGLLLARLAADPEMRLRLGDAAYEAARPYHIRHVAEQYREFLGSL